MERGQCSTGEVHQRSHVHLRLAQLGFGESRGLWMTGRPDCTMHVPSAEGGGVGGKAGLTGRSAPAAPGAMARSASTAPNRPQRHPNRFVTATTRRPTAFPAAGARRVPPACRPFEHRTGAGPGRAIRVNFENLCFEYGPALLARGCVQRRRSTKGHTFAQLT